LPVNDRGFAIHVWHVQERPFVGCKRLIMWAALIALINQQKGQPVGYVNPSLYANPGALHDITSGNNGAYMASGATGLVPPITVFWPSTRTR
jgi:hypothetical protein